MVHSSERKTSKLQCFGRMDRLLERKTGLMKDRPIENPIYSTMGRSRELHMDALKEDSLTSRERGTARRMDELL